MLASACVCARGNFENAIPVDRNGAWSAPSKNCYKVGDLIREAQTESLFSRSSDGLLISFFLYSTRLIVLHSRKIGDGYPIPVWCLKTDIFENRWDEPVQTHDLLRESRFNQFASARFELPNPLWIIENEPNERVDWTESEPNEPFPLLDLPLLDRQLYARR